MRELQKNAKTDFRPNVRNCRSAHKNGVNVESRCSLESYASISFHLRGLFSGVSFLEPGPRRPLLKAQGAARNAPPFFLFFSLVVSPPLAPNAPSPRRVAPGPPPGPGATRRGDGAFGAKGGETTSEKKRNNGGAFRAAPPTPLVPQGPDHAPLRAPCGPHRAPYGSHMGSYEPIWPARGNQVRAVPDSHGRPYGLVPSHMAARGNQVRRRT